VIDDHHQAVSSGEVNVPIASGHFRESQIYGTLGDIVAGKLPGRRGDEITVFDSTGLAIQDVALASLALELARERGIGQEIDLVG
jgi:ornithine cyclodeaminase/alanine dehydrogenase